ncbi:MAG: tRNA (adenosine(37)-N6)-dimethylallyltransferase MiaA [Endozoicomonadaceae bacterium]|nr:tRNA (adenosine(37)-N6)-dimethylallyltransferase MiaA [Endozoicomonadaceae bacterium]
MNGARKPLAIFLMGPTASGKTDLAASLCQRLPCDIISVDSTLVYRGMDIGSAKPAAEMLAKTPHRLINIRDPSEPYSAAEFRQDALKAMTEIVDRGRIPLLVGGTMLYFKTLRDGLAKLPAADDAVRRSIEEQAQRDGWPAVHHRLATVDPVSAARIHPTDSQRLSRAMEVFLISGQTMTELWVQQVAARDRDVDFPYHIINLAVAPKNRKILHERIALRFRQMIDQGFIDEVKRLYARRDLSSQLPAIRSVGYRQVWKYLAKELTWDEMVKLSETATRQLAKRQLTWLRSWPDLIWLNSLSSNLLDDALSVIKLDFT